MDAYVESFQKRGGSMIMIGKGNRSSAVTKSCKQHGGFYLGSIGGVAATLSSNCIKKVQVLDMEELGMEAVWKIEVEDFPAFVIVDNKGDDFFKKWSKDQAEKVAEVGSAGVYDEWRDIFFGIDISQDGSLSAQELSKALNIELSAAEELLDNYDEDKNRKLDIVEFELMLFKKPEVLQMLRTQWAKQEKRLSEKRKSSMSLPGVEVKLARGSEGVFI